MLNRFLEVMAMALLLVLTIGTTFQVLNFQMLRDIQQEIQADRATPIVVESPPPQIVQWPGLPTVAAPSPPQQPAPVAVQEPSPAVQIPVKPVAVKPTPVEPRPEPSEAASKNPAPVPVATEKTTAVPPAQWKRYEKEVMWVIGRLFEGQYDDVYLRFTPRFAEKLSRADLAAAMDDVRKLHGQMGKLVDVSEPDGLQPPDTQTFRVRLTTTGDSLLQFSVTMTPEKTVDGLLFIEVAAP